MDLLNCPYEALYVVGSGVQDVFGGIIVHRKGVVTGGPQIMNTSYHGGVSVPEDGFQHLQILVDGGAL